MIDSLNEKTPPKIGGVATIGDAKLASYELFSVELFSTMHPQIGHLYLPDKQHNIIHTISHNPPVMIDNNRCKI